MSAHDAALAFGLHGMLLFGGHDGLLASHLPMFHPPHDTQVVLRVHVTDPRIDAELRRRLAGPAAVWTLVPERFDLARLGPAHPAPLREFRADIVEGHFERGGVLRYRDVTVRVDGVPLYRALADSADAAADWRYVEVRARDDATEGFRVRLIDRRPGADHVLRERDGAPPETLYWETGDLR